MAREVRVKLLGARKVKKLLKKMDKASRAGLRKGLNKAVTVMKKAIRKEIPGHAKTIKKSVGSKVKVNKKIGASAKVGLNIGKKKGRGYAPHAFLYVAGSKPRQTKSGRSTGRMPAHPVVKRGIAKSQDQAIKEMHAKIDEELKKAKRR